MRDKNHVMAAPAEQIAGWILAALKEEWERDPSPKTCRRSSIVLGPLKPKHKLDDPDIMQGLQFLADRQLIESYTRDAGEVIIPSRLGLDYLAKAQAAVRRRRMSKIKLGLAVLVGFAAILCLALALFK
jgi:hypothetical protein